MAKTRMQQFIEDIEKNSPEIVEDMKPIKPSLFIDDIRQAPTPWMHTARNYTDAIDFLNGFNCNIVSLDHDLGEDENHQPLPTGYDIVKYMCEHGISPERIYIHTDNPVGRDNMYHTLLGARLRGFISEHTKIYHYPIPI